MSDEDWKVLADFVDSRTEKRAAALGLAVRRTEAGWYVLDGRGRLLVGPYWNPGQMLRENG